MHRHVVTIGEKEYRVEQNGEGLVRVDGRTCEVESIGRQEYVVRFDGQAVRIVAADTADGPAVLVHGHVLTPQAMTEREVLMQRYGARGESTQDAKEVRAPMPALVVRIEVQPGQKVRKGDGLIVLEAMKMENEVKSPRDGTVHEVCAQQGKSVEKNEVLLRFQETTA
jgi:biotin carboxyl carrier protein